MVHVAKMKQLKELNIRETKVTDAGLKLLHGMPHLLSVDLTGCKATKAGAEALKKSLPAESPFIFGP